MKTLPTIKFNHKRQITGLLFFLLSFVTSQNCFANKSEEAFSIVTTTTMISSTVESLLSGVPRKISVNALMGPGVDPHLYKPTRGDLALMASSSLIIANGLLLEGKFEETFKRIEAGGKSVIRVGDLVPNSMLRSPKEFNNHPDPHIWMDPMIWKEVAKALASKLQLLIPNIKNELMTNLAKFEAELDQLNSYALKSLQSIPKNQRYLVTAHDAFGYFAKRYNLEVLSIQGISTESEAGIQKVEELVELIVKQKISAVFVESTVSTRNINALIAGAKAKNQSVSVGGELYSDGMGPKGSFEGTYQGMIDHNITTIASALGASVDPAGLFKKLRTKK